MSRLFNDAATEYLAGAWSAITAPPFTMGGWVYVDDAGVLDTSLALMSIADGAVNKYYCLFADMHGDFAGAPAMYVYDSNGNDDWAAASFDPVSGSWYHVCGVIASLSDRRCFANGANKGVDVSLMANVDNIDRLTIAQSADSTPAFWFSGRMAEVFIYNAVLTDREIWQLGALGYPPWRIRPANLMGFWLPFGDRTDRDFSGRGNHLTAYNTPSHGPDPPEVVKLRRPGLMFDRRLTRRVTDPRFTWWSLPWVKSPYRRIFITHT